MFLNVTTQKKINAAENAEIQKKNAEKKRRRAIPPPAK